MTDAYASDETRWNGIEETIQDPEEGKIIFCALDSYMSVELEGIRCLASLDFMPVSVCDCQGLVYPTFVGC